MNYSAIGRVLGLLLMIYAPFPLMAALVAALLGETWLVGGFVIPLAVSLFCGAGLLTANRVTVGALRYHELLGCLCIGWVLIAALSALPIYYTSPTISATDALFDAVAGVTTTGISHQVIPNTLPDSLLFWRALLQWGGGAASLLTLLVLWLGPIYRLDRIGARPSRRHFREGRRIGILPFLLLIYVLLTLACFVASQLSGLDSYDSTLVALATPATGGWAGADFFTKAALIPLMILLLPFMILAATNFILLAHWLRRRVTVNLPYATALLEWRLLIVLIAVVMAGACYYRLPAEMLGGDDLIRMLFAATALVTTSGWTIDGWGSGDAERVVFPLALVLSVTLIGGSAISTAGGIKILRPALIMLLARREIAILFSPQALHPLRHRLYAMDGDTSRRLIALCGIYLMAVAGVALALAFSGCDFETSFLLSASAFANHGSAPFLTEAIDTTINPFALLSDGAKWWLIAAMLLGRVEILAFPGFLTALWWRA